MRINLALQMLYINMLTDKHRVTEVRHTIYPKSSHIMITAERDLDEHYHNFTLDEDGLRMAQRPRKYG